MSERFDCRVTADGATRTLEVELEISAPVEQVWSALTEAEELMRWFPFQAEVDPGEGGQIRMSWDGAYDSALDVEVWEPGRRLRTTWPAHSEVPGEPPAPTVVDYRIEPRGGGATRLRLVHSGFPAADDWDGVFDGHLRGWSYELRCLRHYLENHHGTTRRVVRVRRPLGALSREQTWRLLFSPAGLIAGGDIDPAAAGGGYAITLPSGHRLAGRVLIAFPPHELGATVAAVDGVAGSESSLLRVSIERCGGPDGELEVALWLATWGVSEGDVRAISESWGEMLEGMMARSKPGERSSPAARLEGAGGPGSPSAYGSP
jgi:uncharacterized protein YndB with AHSA1/START domain